MPIPTSEPASLTAGATTLWTRTLPDYPASAFTLRYALQSPPLPLITITAVEDESVADRHAITIDSATSAQFAPGSYTYTAFAEQRGSDPINRTILAVGTITILPSPLATVPTTHATRTLALIEAALEQRIPNGLESTNIDGQELSRIPIFRLRELRTLYKAEVALERAAARTAVGLSARRTIGIRFVRP